MGAVFCLEIDEPCIWQGVRIERIILCVQLLRCCKVKRSELDFMQHPGVSGVTEEWQWPEARRLVVANGRQVTSH